MQTRCLLLGLIAGVCLAAIVAGALVVYVHTRPVERPNLPGQSGRQVLRIMADETLLSALVGRAARAQDMALEGVTVDLRPGGWLDILFGVEVAVAGQTATVQLKLIGALSVVGGQPQLSIAQVELAGVPVSVELLPSTMQAKMDAIMKNANEVVVRSLVEEGLRVLSLQTDENTLSVSMALSEN